jgi:hypothetical protein
MSGLSKVEMSASMKGRVPLATFSGTLSATASWPGTDTSFYALNVLRLDRSFLMPDGSLFRVHHRLSGFGWGLGPLF